MLDLGSGVVGGARGWVAGRAGLWGVPLTWVWVVVVSPQILEHPTSICDTGVKQGKTLTSDEEGCFAGGIFLTFSFLSFLFLPTESALPLGTCFKSLDFDFFSFDTFSMPSEAFPFKIDMNKKSQNSDIFLRHKMYSISVIIVVGNGKTMGHIPHVKDAHGS